MADVDNVIDTTHFKSFKHVKHVVPNMRPAELREVLRKRLHDKQMRLPQTKPYMRKIFERTLDCYFHDLLVQPGDVEPKYYHIFIGSNNRYAFAYPVNNKDAKTLVGSLKQFLKDVKRTPVKLTSDDEKGLDSKEFIAACAQKNIATKFIPDKAHSTLGIIDRFIRTLRDMNQPANRSKDQQYSKDYIVFTPAKMKSLIDSYNNAYHNSIGCSPKEMYNNEDLERKYIAKRLKQRAVQDAIKDFELPVGIYVRYKMNNYDLAGHKRRSQLSREKFLINKRIGSRYLLQAADGKIISKSRFELVKAEPEDPIGLTFEQNDRVNPESVITGDFNH